MFNKQDRILIKKLYTMMDTLSLINSTLDLDKLLQLIMSSIKKVMDCEASSLMLLDPDKNELYFYTVSGGSKIVKEIRIKADQGIAGHVVQNGKPIIINNVSRSNFFLNTIDQKTRFKTRSIMAVPLLSRGKTIGVLEALNKKHGKKFTGEDVRLFTAFSNQVSISIDNTKLYNMAFYDALTKLFVRQYVEAWLETEYSRVKRYNTDLSVIMLDIDHFKKINDTYGHPAGDFVLREVAVSVKKIIRGADVFGRYGGEEFIICLPETKPIKASKSAERIRKMIEEKDFIYEGKKIAVTMSAGIACFKKTPEETISKFIKNADTALYYSKQHGRNRTTIFSKSLQPEKNRLPY